MGSGEDLGGKAMMFNLLQVWETTATTESMDQRARLYNDGGSMEGGARLSVHCHILDACCLGRCHHDHNYLPRLFVNT